MITLYCFSPTPGAPDASPFVVKTMTLLKLAGLDYVEDRTGFSRAPKGKQPYIDDDGEIVADSTFIRWRIEKTRAFDFDAGLTPEQRAIAWAIEKMCEEHLYWIIVCDRWLDDVNFERGPARFFQSAPAYVRPFAKWFVRRQVRKAAHAQGIARHKPEEIAALGARDIDALSTLLGDKPYLFGERPCGADATVFAFMASLMTPIAESPTRDAALAKPNLVAYRNRMMKAYFPEIAEAGV